MAHAGGRPLKFQSVDELQQKIDEYFDVTTKDEWTWTGLALHLDTTRQTLYAYSDREEFVYPIKKALMKVENGYETDLKKHGRSGTIFALKNFDWKDKSEQEIRVEDVTPILGGNTKDVPTNNSYDETTEA